MKHIVILALVCLPHFFAQAQDVPQGIAYQAVAVKDGSYSVAGQNPQAIYWSNKDIKVRFTIFERYPNGSSQYSELHEVTTDDYGVFNVIIGQGVTISGDFEIIPWELGTAHLQVEIDFENTNTFTLTSMERFWSVPYAFVTNQSDGSNMDSALDDLNNKYDYLKNRDKDTVIGNEGISYQTLDSINKALQAQIAALKFSDKDTVVGNELQTLSLTEDSLEISDGNMIVIKHPENLDNDSTNELQSISLANDTISLSNGGGSVTLSEIKTYVENNTSFSSSNNVYDNGACFEGVLVDLNEWAFANGASVPRFLGEIADSVVVFNCRISSQWKVFIHDIKRDTIISSNIASSYTSYFFGDSVVYASTKGSVILYKIDSDLNASVIATFSGGPPSYGAIVNESKDLIWIDASDDLKKYDYAAKTIYTYSNTQSGSYNLLHQLVAHDTILLGNRLMDSKKMTVLQTFPFLDGLAEGKVIYWNGEIYYASSTNGFRVYNISTTQDFRLSRVTGLELYGTNNGELWLGFSISRASSGATFMNQYLPPGATSLLTMNKAGVVQYRGVDPLDYNRLRTRPSNKKISLSYAPGQGIDGLCVNGMWTRGIGYFYSR